jgi:hypothetical protein
MQRSTDAQIVRIEDYDLLRSGWFSEIVSAASRILLREYLILISQDSEILLLNTWAAIINHDSLDLGSPHRIPQR